MTYKQAYEYIEECAKYGSVPGLDSITELCHRLGDPQDGLKFIHIAGTNGKGSILAYISSILMSAGLKTGRYISPTIRDYLERFDINGRPMSKTAFAGYMEKVIPVCEAMAEEGMAHPTAFEIETAVAFLYFADKNCDIVVLECGMGGRLDATNIIKGTLLSVFAHIDMDHMQYLGDTLKKIAGQKAGIIREGIPVVTGDQEADVMEVLRDEAATHKAPLWTVTSKDDTDFDGSSRISYVSDVSCNIKGGSFTIKDTEGKSKCKCKTPLLGTHQIYNAAVAVTAIKALKAVCEDKTASASIPDKFKSSVTKKLTDEAICAGLMKTKWPGRLQIVSKKPLTIIDGAHNPDAARRLKESLDMLCPDKKRILIMGMLKDKDIKTVADIMCRDADMVLTITPPENPRALRSVELAGIVSEYNKNVSSLDSAEEAVEIAKIYASEHEGCVIVAFGSLSFMGRMMNIYNEE